MMQKRQVSSWTSTFSRIPADLFLGGSHSGRDGLQRVQRRLGLHTFFGFLFFSLLVESASVCLWAVWALRLLRLRFDGMKWSRCEDKVTLTYLFNSLIDVGSSYITGISHSWVNCREVYLRTAMHYCIISQNALRSLVCDIRRTDIY